MTQLRLNNLCKSYGDTPIIRDLSLEIASGEFVVFVGPSGSGKSTLIRMIAGLEEITSGELLIDGRRMNEAPPAARGLAMVFQSYALYPHMTVRQNMGFALKMAGMAKAQRDSKVEQAAEVLRLTPYLERKPGQLSGGQRQRVAIGRAIVREPGLFLFDEPLSNLDTALRGQMRLELARLHAQLDATMIYVTHDQVEAMTLADRIVVLRDGLVEQVGAPLEIYRRPRNLFVAEFIGSPRMNLLAGVVQALGPTGVRVALAQGGEVTAPVQAEGLSIGQTVTLGVRPEGLSPAPDSALQGTVRLIEALGATTLVHLDLGNEAQLVWQAAGDQAVRVGDRLSLAASPTHCHVFDQAGLAAARLPE